MRTAGAVLVLAAGGLCGFWAASRLQKRIAVLEAVRLWIRYMETEFRFHATPLNETLAGCVQQAAFRELTFLKAGLCGNGVPMEEMAKAVNREKKTLALTDEDVVLLIRLIEGLGRTDLQGQQAHLAHCAKRIEEQETLAREVYLRRGKIYRVAGICTAAAMVLVFW